MSRFLRTVSTAYNGLAAARPTVGVCATCWRSYFSTSTRPTLEPPRARHDQRRLRSSSGQMGLFEKMVDSLFRQVAPSSKAWAEVEKDLVPFGIKDMRHLRREEEAFVRAIKAAFNEAGTKDTKKDNTLFDSLRVAFIQGDVKGLSSKLHFLFRNFLLRNRFSKPVTDVQRQLADFRYPWEWFPATRALQRTVHLHVGPTNSGKTYHALKALENAESGVYCGPLRLLAHEVYSRLIAKGKPCALLTGEEQRRPTDTDRYYISCTVEMTPTNALFDVAVIDEIQMIADPDRGSSWTGAFLGVQAKEVHLCGEERTVSLIKSICASIGDTCIVHRYDRLTPLEASRKSIGKGLENLEKGDCVVAFSRVAIHALKATIEKKTGRRCAVIYGSLPPETRTQQAALFNDPDNDYDFLAASDAIGMGLNLEIKRIVFEAVTKRDGFSTRQLTISEIRQIGGRAGRFRTARDAIISRPAEGAEGAEGAEQVAAPPADDSEKAGRVTTLDPVDLPLVQKNLWKDAQQITTAAIVPPVSFIERFSTYFAPGTPLSFILLRLQELAVVSERFQLCIKDTFLELLDSIEEFPMSVYDRLVLMTAPVSFRSFGNRETLQAIARCIAERGGGHILDIPEIPLELLDVDFASLAESEGPLYLQNLESLHHSVVLYLWVSYRFPHIFTAQSLGFHIRDLTQEKINEYLSSMSWADDMGDARRRQQRRQAEHRLKLQRDLLGENAGGDVPIEEGPGRWNEEGHEEPLTQSPEEAAQLAATRERASQ